VNAYKTFDNFIASLYLQLLFDDSDEFSIGRYSVMCREHIVGHGYLDFPDDHLRLFYHEESCKKRCLALSPMNDLSLNMLMVAAFAQKFDMPASMITVSHY
jgi:hypothetical protein